MTTQYQVTIDTTGATDKYVGLRLNHDGYVAGNHNHGIYMTVDGATPSGYNSYGINVASVTGGDNNFGLYIDGGATGSYFKYAIGIGQLPSSSYVLYVYDNTTAQYAMGIRQDHTTGHGLLIIADAIYGLTRKR